MKGTAGMSTALPTRRAFLKASAASYRTYCTTTTDLSI
jgi:hypothetical protein